MEQRNKTLRQAGRAALYAVFKARHRRSKRLFVAFESFSIAFVFLLTITLQTYLQVNPPTYALDPAVKSLVGETRDDAATYLKDDAQAKAFRFSVPKTDDSGGDASAHTGRIADAYEASLAKDAREGITVTEKESQIAVNLTPTFKTYEGKKVEGDHVVYLAQGGVKLVYTLKYNGLKEDIIVPSYRGDKLEYGFELSLPAGTEARLDGNGNIGIYSSDPTLFGEISFGSDDDRARVEKARENGEKTNLVMTIPYPVVKDATGQEYTDKAKFSLGEKQTKTSQAAADPKLPAEVQEKMKASTTKNVYQLTIASQGLKGLSYPLSIDPTMQVTSASDFNGLNNEGGVEVDTTNNLIRRSRLRGGVLNAWTTDTGGNFSTPRNRAKSVAANGYIYVIGGNAVAGQPTIANVEYAPLDPANGSIGAWQSTTGLPAGKGNPGVVFAQGNIYVMGGDDGDNGSTSVYSNRIKSDGSLQSSWTTNTVLNSARTGLGAAYYNGYIYITGGSTKAGGATYYSSTEYALVRADGTIGSWTTDTDNFATPRAGISAEIHNGYLYVAGGNDTTNWKTDVQYTKINTDGSVGSWITATSLASARGSAGSFIANGYFYMVGGCSAGSCSTLLADSVFAQINADGSLGTWRTTTSFTTQRYSAGMAYYNGYAYLLGGCTATGGPCTSYNNDAQYTTVKPAGELLGFSTTNAITTARVGHATVAYNGFIYAIGGCINVSGGSGSTTNCTTATSSIEYGTINANGTITWNGTTTGINNARWGISAVAYNGYLYVVSGCNVGALGSCSRQNNTFWAPINADGTIGTMTTDTDGFQVRSYYGLAAYNGYLYTVGGDTADNTQRTSVQKTQIQTDGSVGAWSNETSLPVATRDLQVAAYNGYLYAYINNSGLYSIAVNSNGTLGASWANQINGSAVAGNSNMIIDRGHVYVVHATGARIIDYGRLTANGGVTNATGGTGTLTAAAPSPNMTNPHDWSSSVAGYNGRIYTVSGCSGSTGDNCDSVTASVEYAEINNGGNGLATGAFTSTDPWSSGRFGHASVVQNGYMYISAGKYIEDNGVLANTRDAVASIQIGTIDTITGNVSSWGFTTPLPSARIYHQMVAVNGYMYVIGGEDGNFNRQNTVWRATINASTGALGTWDVLTAFPQALGDHSAVVIGSTIYVIGGINSGGTPLDTVYRATVDGSGNLGSWTTTTNLPSARRLHKAVTMNGKIFITGGINTDAVSDLYSDILVADVAADGSVGAWRFAGTMPSRRHSHVAAVSNGYLYIGQGCATVISIATCAAGAINDMHAAPIGPSGSIGTWGNTSNSDIGRVQSTTHVVAGRLYLTGGCYNDCLTDIGYVSNRTRWIGLQSIPRIGSFSKRYDFDVGVKPTKLITRGTKQNGAVVGVNYSSNVACGGTAFDNAQGSSDIAYMGANALSLSLGSSRTLARCLLLRYTIDDSQSAVFPDSGNETTITDFDVYFTANPGQRLRGGRTFTNGVDRGLDAQPQP